MRKRRIVLLCTAVWVCAVAAWLLSQSREPRYQGRPLSEWVIQLVISGNSSDVNEAIRALRAIGPKATPYLLARSKTGTPLWRKTGQDLNETLPRFVQERIAGQEWLSYHRLGGSLRAFKVLGAEAQGAIPELARRLNIPYQDPSATYASEVLANIGDLGRPIFVQALTNAAPIVRRRAAHGLSLLGPGAAPAIPSLKRALSDIDPDESSSAARNLRVECRGAVYHLMNRGDRRMDVTPGAPTEVNQTHGEALSR